MKTGQKLLAAFIMLAAFLIMASAASAIEYSVAQHTISVQINLEENDTVVEKFIINFPSETDKIDFRNKSISLGTRLDAWQGFDGRFQPSLGENTANKKIAYTEGEPNYLQISYTLNEPLMAKGKEATMLTEYSLKVNYFNSFYQSGLWIIPEQTAISIELPPGAEIKDTIVPDATTYSNGTRKVVSWQGYKSANKLALNFVVWKKIEPVVDLNEFTNFLFKTQTGWILIIAVIVIIAIIAWKRKEIGEKIDTFVENHSAIKEE